MQELETASLTEDTLVIFRYEQYVKNGKITDIDVPLYYSCSFFNIVQNAFDPLPPPLPFEHLLDFFSRGWEALCTALRLDNMMHRSEENMSNIT